MKLPLLSILWVSVLGNTQNGGDGHNHAPLLTYPKGLTADRQSQGSLPLSLPPGYDDDEAESPLHHAPLLHHPKGLTADRKSQGALKLAAPPGSEAGSAEADDGEATEGFFGRLSSWFSSNEEPSVVESTTIGDQSEQDSGFFKSILKAFHVV
eukprot:Protomagalhaensia_wolfi_Nauph_80__5256@NODE_566_length_2279_cov_719_388839_g422_i0_p3_GENE_NODE_566_length_2279_cov_719_388839_g422_i0NODE_566_length_2279_cov_719_388839_g422_i0_p3_ORF_typecomplete_len153_score16_51DUF4990/PF16380_5/1_7DUF4990/PF16380_5/2e02_NODE_566_length_2279_cov_719_388839_g422_i05651023